MYSQHVVLHYVMEQAVIKKKKPFSITAALEGGEWSAARPGRTLPPGKTRYLFYSRQGGPQGRCGRAENLVPTEIRSRTVQPVAQSLYRLSYRAHLSKNTPISNFIKISPVGTELFHSNGQTDRHDDADSRFSQFFESA